MPSAVPVPNPGQPFGAYALAVDPDAVAAAGRRLLVLAERLATTGHQVCGSLATAGCALPGSPVPGAAARLAHVWWTVVCGEAELLRGAARALVAGGQAYADLERRLRSTATP